VKNTIQVTITAYDHATTVLEQIASGEPLQPHVAFQALLYARLALEVARRFEATLKAVEATLEANKPEAKND